MKKNIETNLKINVNCKNKNQNIKNNMHENQFIS